MPSPSEGQSGVTRHFVQEGLEQFFIQPRFVHFRLSGLIIKTEPPLLFRLVQDYNIFYNISAHETSHKYTQSLLKEAPLPIVCRREPPFIRQ